MNYFRLFLFLVLSLQLYGASHRDSWLNNDCWDSPPTKASARLTDESASANGDSLDEWDLFSPPQTSAAFNQRENRGLEILRGLYPDLFPKSSRGIVLILSDAVTSSVTGVAENIAFCSLSVAAAHILAGASTSAALEIACSSVVGSVVALSAPTTLTALGMGTLMLAASNAGREVAGRVSEKVSTFVRCTYTQEEWPLVRNAALVALVSPIMLQTSTKFEGADAQEILMRLHQFSSTFRNYRFEPFRGSQEDKFIQKEDLDDGSMIYRIILNLELKTGIKILVSWDQSLVLGNNSLA